MNTSPQSFAPASARSYAPIRKGSASAPKVERPEDNPTRGTAQRLGHILIRDGVIDPVMEERAAEIQRQSPERKFGEILVEDLGVDHHAVFSRLAEIYAFKGFDLQAHQIDDGQIDFIRRTLEALPVDARAQVLLKRVLPVRILARASEVLLIVTPDPMDRDVLYLAPAFGYRRTEIRYARKDAIEEVIARIGPTVNKYLAHVAQAGLPLEADDEDAGLDEGALDAEINQSLLTNLVEGCLVEAVRRGASDIHIVPQDGSRTEIHFRIDGNLQLWHVQDKAKPEAVVAVVKDRARGVDRFSRDRAQDGFLQREIDGALIRFRVSVLPLAGREPHRKLEDVVLRILDDRKVITDLGKLGLQPSALQAFEAAIAKPQGMVILTGPTGSGKSTTLNAALHRVSDPTRCVLTVEDPVEYLLRGARQIKLSPNLSFDDAVRTILRHDPDIVMVGEMRDTQTAETAIKLANTGHLTLTTLHTNDAPSAVSRLYKMGVEPFLIASSVNIVLAQRLVPTLCAKCKEPHTPDATFREACLAAGMTAAQFDGASLFRAAGCPACGWTGYRGRTGIHEALPFTKEIRQAITQARNGVDGETLRELAIRQGMVTLRQSGLVRVAEGETSLSAVLSTTAGEA